MNSKIDQKHRVEALPSADEALQNYEFIKIVATGAFGKVYKAKDKINNRYVAIKLIEDVAASDMHTRSAIREVSILR